jgi:hypothetical protein
MEQWKWGIGTMDVLGHCPNIPFFQNPIFHHPSFPLFQLRAERAKFIAWRLGGSPEEAVLDDFQQQDHFSRSQIFQTANQVEECGQ